MRLHAVVAGWQFDGRASGAARRQTMMLKELAPLLTSGEEVTLVHSEDHPPRDLPDGIRMLPVAIPPGPTWRRALAERRVLPGLLENVGATLLDLGTLPVPRHLPCPVVLTLHDLRDLGPFRRRPIWLARKVLQHAMAGTAAVVVPSVATAVAVRDAVATPPPLHVVPNGVDERFFKARSGQPFARPYLLHVGHLEPRKNLLMLLSAFAQVVERRLASSPHEEPPRLVLAGADHGSLRELRERAALLDLSGHVDFMMEVDDEQLLALYAGALGVVVPSLDEGFGLAALEGMAAGRAVLVSDRGALPEVVDDGGLVLPAEDPGAWATAMRELIEAPARFSELSLRAGARARELSWRRAAEEMLQVWRSV